MGSAPFCMREVRLLTQIADDGLRLTDLHVVPDNTGEPPRLARLKSLHLHTGDGEWLTGVDVYGCEPGPTPAGAFCSGCYAGR